MLACTDPHTDIGKAIVGGGFGWWCESNDSIIFSDKVNEICMKILFDMSEKSFGSLKQCYCSEQLYKNLDRSVNLWRSVGGKGTIVSRN